MEAREPLEVNLSRTDPKKARHLTEGVASDKMTNDVCMTGKEKEHNSQSLSNYPAWGATCSSELQNVHFHFRSFMTSRLSN